MCRSIKTLRPPYTEGATADEVNAAALQYVRKVAGMRRPSRANEAAFEAAVAEIADSTARLLATLHVARDVSVRRTPRSSPPSRV
jgi:hypothetical protein